MSFLRSNPIYVSEEIKLIFQPPKVEQLRQLLAMEKKKKTAAALQVISLISLGRKRGARGIAKTETWYFWSKNNPPFFYKASRG